MWCDRVFKLMLTSRCNHVMPIWSMRARDRLVSFRVTNPLPKAFPARSFSLACPLTQTSTSGNVPTSPKSDTNPSAAPVSSKPPSVTIEIQNGLPHVTVPLPSRNEPCVFVLKPVTHNVGDFLSMLKREDAGIDRAIIRTPDGIRIASTTSIQSLLKGDFLLVINDIPFSIRAPPTLLHTELGTTSLSEEELQRLGDVRALVNQLYETLHVEENNALQEKKLVEEMEALQQELQPLEEQRLEIEKLVEKRTKNLTWLGLGMMSIQFGILARLTWWEYSWDIMEPVTYFVTYGTAMACYAYFVLTKQDYVLNDVRDRQFLLTFHKKARRNFWDVHKYNALKDGIAKVDRDLRRLRDPLLSSKASNIGVNANDSLGRTEQAGVAGMLTSQININKFKDLLKGKLS